MSTGKPKLSVPQKLKLIEMVMKYQGILPKSVIEKLWQDVKQLQQK